MRESGFAASGLFIYQAAADPLIVKLTNAFQGRFK